MQLRLLFDENMDPAYKAAVLRLYPGIDVLAVGDPEAPPKGTLDPEILLFLDQSQRLLVTNNRRSIIEQHLPAHLGAGGQSWGIFWVRRGTTFRELAEELHLIWENSEAEDWTGRYLTLPYFI